MELEPSFCVMLDPAQASGFGLLGQAKHGAELVPLNGRPTIPHGDQTPVDRAAIRRFDTEARLDQFLEPRPAEARRVGPDHWQRSPD
jgi:hypothetical protein